MKASPRKFELTADILLRAYSIGVFPMAESREAKELFWVEPHDAGDFSADFLHPVLHERDSLAAAYPWKILSASLRPDFSAISSSSSNGGSLPPFRRVAERSKSA